MKTYRLHSVLLLFALVALALPWSLLAQDTSRVALPNIAPREVEIRGTLEVSLPSLQRQPLVGFNPPPVVPRPPAGRSPFVERYKQSSSDLPTSPLQRPLPPSALGASTAPAAGQVESLVGRYFSRAVNARLQAPVADRTALFLRADYTGSEGHEPFDTIPDLNAPFDALEGMAGVKTSGNTWAAGFSFSGFYESFDLFGLQPLSLPSDLSALARVEREGRGIAGAATLATLAEAPIEARLDLQYGTTRYETRDVTSTAAATPLSENRFDADAEAKYPFSVGDAWAEGTLSTATLGEDLGYYSAFEAGGGLHLEVNPTLSLRVGLRLLGVFSDTDEPRTGAEEHNSG